MAAAESGAMRRVLIVSPQFPPSSLVGAQRARHLATHLGAHGWEPTVLTVRPDDDEEALDHRLAALVPERVEILRAAPVPKRFARRLGVGDLGLRAYASLRRAILNRVEARACDLVFITGFPFYPMLVAPEIRRRGTPVVLDFQDPWISDYGAARPLLSKAGLAHRLALALEPRAVAAASGVMAVSEVQIEAMRRRHPGLAAECWLALPIGGEPADYDAVAPSGPAGATLLYAGAFLPRAGKTLTALFRAVGELRAAEPRRFDGARLRFIGTAAVTDRSAAPVVTPIAAAHGVADLVDETPWRLPYLDALAGMRAAAANLLIGSDEPHYTASKIYPALMSGRPFLSLFHERSSSHEILSRAGGGIALGFGEAGPETLGPELREALAAALDPGWRPGAADPAIVAPFTAHEIARRCGAFFDRIVRSGDAR